jgi:hypothetical protein
MYTHVLKKNVHTIQMTRSRYVNSQTAVAPRTRTTRRISKSTRRAPKGWALPYAGRSHVTARAIPVHVAKVSSSRINKLLKQRANLNKLILLSIPRSTRSSAPNVSHLREQRNKINRNIQKYRAMTSHAKYVSGPMFANMLVNVNASR